MDEKIDVKQKLLDSIRKEFGSQSVCLLGQNEKFMDIKVRSSGSLLLDLILGGGYPEGRLIELVGPEHAGKSTIACLAIAEAQISEPDKYCAFIDLEHAFNPEWAKTLGVDVDNLYFAQPDTYAEKIFEMLLFMIRTGCYSVIVLDSVASLILKSEMEEDDWEQNSRVGGTSGLMTKAMRKLVYSGELAKSGTTLIFINQLRDKIGGFAMNGNVPTTSPAGRALKHTSTIRLEIAKGQQFAKGTGENREVFGQEMKIKCVKNKIAPPYRSTTIDLYFDTGVDRITELVKIAKEINVLQGTSWLKFINPSTGELMTDENGAEIKFNGVNKAVEFLKEDIKGEAKIYTMLYDVVNEVLRGE